ncbi:hypothetical protein [Nocardioides perillae]|uniref:Uncharacterized protein n=1 Tax=Nocardioides perillae TaxID=1119534 RepID=A0A7Y9US71_9ACTN|nr:hypothetical protein [Nocardioides perillae]NYG55319.1 hypothetical protein [Nocardioides perillae]
MRTLDASLRPQPAVLDSLRSSIGRYLSTASSTSWAPRVSAPPPPETTQTIEAGVSISQSAVHRAAEHHKERRTQLHRLVASDGWSWEGAG